MSEKREILGQWWLPGAADEQWLGTLTLAPDASPRLQVTVPKRYYSFKPSTPPPVILGKDKFGCPITLLFPGFSGSNGATSLSQLNFTAGHAIIGLHVIQPADLKVNTIRFQLQHLAGWLAITGFNNERLDLADPFRISYKPPPKPVFTLPSGRTLSLGTSWSFTSDQSRQSITENHQLEFASADGFSLVDSRELLTAARLLLHFATLRPVYPLSVTAEKAGYGHTLDQRFYPHNIELFNSLIRAPVDALTQDDHWIFRFADLKKDFAKRFASWLTFCTRQQESLACYNTTIHHHLPDSLHFLTLAQALEAYHGIKHGRADFKDRIRAVATELLPHLDGLVSDSASLAEAVRINRNYYTHHDPSIKKKGGVLTGAALYRLTEKLRLIFQMCVLTELGIPAERFVRLRRQLATEIIDYI